MKRAFCDLCGKSACTERKLMFDIHNIYDICEDCYKKLIQQINDTKRFGPKE